MGTRDLLQPLRPGVGRAPSLARGVSSVRRLARRRIHAHEAGALNRLHQSLRAQRGDVAERAERAVVVARRRGRCLAHTGHVRAAISVRATLGVAPTNAVGRLVTAVAGGAAAHEVGLADCVSPRLGGAAGLVTGCKRTCGQEMAEIAVNLERVTVSSRPDAAGLTGSRSVPSCLRERRSRVPPACSRSSRPRRSRFG